MRAAWRRVARRCDTQAFTAQEVSEALVSALEQDCRMDMTLDFLSRVRRVDGEPSLFATDVAMRLESLRSVAGYGMGRALLDNVVLLSTTEQDASTVVPQAFTAVLADRASRCARQVEEHYLRESSAPRAHDVRGRLKEAIESTDLASVARRFLSVNPGQGPSSPVRRTGLDDGVLLR